MCRLFVQNRKRDDSRSAGFALARGIVSEAEENSMEDCSRAGAGKLDLWTIAEISRR